MEIPPAHGCPELLQILPVTGLVSASCGDARALPTLYPCRTFNRTGCDACVARRSPRGIPPGRFQILTEHAPEDLIYDASYLGIARTDDIVMIQIVLNQRPTNVKLALYKAITEQYVKESP